MSARISISSQNLKQRRERLRQRRKIEFWQATWRVVILTGVFGGLCWNFVLPNWTIRQESQIQVSGNKYLTNAAIKELLELSYPESILRVSPQKLVEQLQENGAIESATVARQLVPPRLTVAVKERPPVAIALSPIAKLEAPGSYIKEIGFLDEKGIWMSKASYKMLPDDLLVPTLKITGPRSHYLPYWQEIYSEIRHSPIAIYELDWQDPRNLILKTELGKVHLGSHISQFSQQLAVLSQMQELPARISPSRIAYIDLKNYRAPKVQLHSR